MSEGSVTYPPTSEREIVDPDLHSVGNCYVSTSGDLFAKVIYDNSGKQSLHVRTKCDSTWGPLFIISGVGGYVAFSLDEQYIFYTRVDFTLRACELWVAPIHDLSNSACIWRERDRDFHIVPYLSGNRIFVRISSAKCTETREIVSTSDGWSTQLRVPRRLGLIHRIVSAPLDQDHDTILARVVGSDGQARLYFDSGRCGIWGKLDPRCWTLLFVSKLSEALVDIYPLPGSRSILTLRQGGRPAVAVLDFKSLSHPVLLHLTFSELGHDYVRILDVVPERRCAYLSVVGEDAKGCIFEVNVDSLLKTPVGFWSPFMTKNPVVFEEIYSPRIPSLSITILRRQDLHRDGKNPGILHVYGCYGVSQDADEAFEFSPLIDAGVVVALAHVRGGGELGSAWHRGGRFPLKLNAVTDLEDCAQTLIESGWIDSRMLGSSSGSAGSAIALSAVNRGIWRPCGCVCRSPFVNVARSLRRDYDPVSRSDFIEFGNPADGLYSRRKIRAVSPTSGVHSMDYPDILVSTGGCDSRISNLDVAFWIFKMAIFSHRNVWLSHLSDGGHGTRDFATEIAFWRYCFSSACS